MGLAEYKRKRDFAKTAEPSGARGKPLPKAVKGASRFIIQKHDATRLHYDFRLEMEGVLKSWAVPKGLPWTQGEKHLAVEVEDHPVEYATFEGVIPEGQYGGGTVMLWDRGKYYVYGEQPLKALHEGKMHLVLDGEKSKGEWTLVRLRGSESKPQWLLMKTGESIKPLSKKLDDQSVKSGRTMAEIAGDRDAEWQSNRSESDQSSASVKLKSRIKAALKKKEEAQVSDAKRRRNGKSRSHVQPGNKDASGAPVPGLHDIDLTQLPAAKPRFIEPMKARLVEDVPIAGDWMYELKFDGFRACAVKNGSKVNLFSRNGNDLRSRFPEIAEAMQDLGVEECVMDGEIVALDEKGRSSFQLLQAIELEGRKAPLRFYLFDLLQLEGRSLLNLPLTARKQLLAGVSEGANELIRYSGELGRDPKPLLAEVERIGLEGLIGKLRDSVYEPGRRSGSWIKIKAVHEQEFVIGGFTPPAGSRKHFGAILVGYYDGKRQLRFAGKVGTGFNEKTLATLRRQFRKEERDSCPFIDLPSKEGGKWAQGITPSMMKKMHWINPKFVAQIKFAEWTRDAKLRQPVFLGLRDDKAPGEVVRES